MKRVTIHNLILVGTFIFLFTLFLLLSIVPSLHAGIQSQSYSIPAYVLNGGGLQSVSENFRQVISLGESTPTGFSQSEHFKNYAGFIPQITILSLCNVTRSVPGYVPGVSVTIKIEVNPNDQTVSYAVEDTPPAGWPVSDINEGGTWDNVNQKVKWGPFFDNNSRTLTYNVEAPYDANGCYPLSGTASFDGANQSICGDVEICEGLPHPADTNFDWCLSISEVTGYGAAWKKGEEWPYGPNPIPIDYVTRAGYIWKKGECYYYIPWIDEPLCWKPITIQLAARKREIPETPIISYSFDPNSYMPGQPITVTIDVTPSQSTVAYAMEDAPPYGWQVDPNIINYGGGWDTINQKVKWGPFFDNQQRTFTYQVTPPSEVSGKKAFHGVFSANGIDFSIDREIPYDGVMKLSLGWSMISLPVMPDNANLSAVFPEAVVMYLYNRGTGYVRVKSDDDLEAGRGYWILLNDAQTYQMNGQPILEYTLPINEDGWEMVGGCVSPAKASGNDCNIGVIYGFKKESGYQRIPEGESLAPCKGYWILFSNSSDQSELRVTTQF